MGAYVLRRLLWGVLIVWGVYTLSFFAVDAAPGDPFDGIEAPKMKPEDFDRLRVKWGYLREVRETVETAPGVREERTRLEEVPAWRRYLLQLGNVLQGDLGTSIYQKRPVTHMLKQAIPNTLILSGTALVLEFV